MKREIMISEAGKLFSRNGFLIADYPLKCSILGNNNVWIFQVSFLWGVEKKLITGMSENEEYLEIKKFVSPDSINISRFMDSFLKKNCKEYKGKLLVETEGWGNEC